MYSYGRAGLGAAPKVSRDEAKRAVQAIYLELLLRDPWNPYDAGAEGYVNCLVEGWCNVDFVRTEVIKAPEYRDKELARAQQVYSSPTSAIPGSNLVPTSSPGSTYYSAPMGMDGGGGLTTMTVAGIPVLYLAGGLVLLMMLKKR